MWLSEIELLELNLGHLGARVKIDSQARIINPASCLLGNDVRIDAFSLLSAGVGSIFIGNNVHISSSARLFGAGGILIEDFCTVSVGVSIFSISDDFTSGMLTNPTVSDSFRNVSQAKVVLGAHSIVGAHSVILPGVSIGRGGTVGAMSLVKKDIRNYEIWAGNPIKLLGHRPVEVINEQERLFGLEQGDE
jgi:galactoside O-acetyltransferase